MSEIPCELTKLVADAADGKSGAAARFFEVLLNSNVFVPLKAVGSEVEEKATEIPIIGQSSLEELGFLTVSYEGKETLPIFSELQFVNDWAEREITAVSKEFKQLLWLLGEDFWMYLNPAQEVGKEITPWEIEQLRLGVEAIPELVAALDEGNDSELLVHTDSALYPELKTKLRPVLEIYPELLEAFLIGVKDSEESEERPLLGIKYGNITEAKRLYLRSEFESISKETLPGHQRLVIIEDLGDKNSPNIDLFSGSTPFYLATKVVPQETSPVKQMFSRLRKKLTED